MSDSPAPPTKRQVIAHDVGGWLSGPCLDDDALTAVLTVGCDIHQVPAGEPCPLTGACVRRCAIAAGTA